MKLRTAATATVSVTLLILAVACSGSNGGSGFDNGGGGGGGGSGDNGGGAGGGGSSFGAGGGGSGTFGGDDGGENLGDAACASEKTTAQQEPLDMYIMLDQSGSMNDTVAGGGTKWQAVTGALNTFVGSPVTGISVGLQYFALPASGGSSCPSSCTQTSDCGAASNGPCIGGICIGCLGGGGGDSCNAADYAKAEVEIAALPGVATQIQQSLSQHSPSTSTPTSAALQGAVQHATAWATAHTSDVVVAVLATDGDPTECDTNISDIDAIAAAGVNGKPKILTFVIGVGASTGNLNSIAAAGGTNTAFFVDTTKNVNQQFLQALNTIRGTALGCTYKIPLPTSGTPDYSSVNVEYTPGGGGSPQLIPQVPNKAACPSSGNAWYYDNPSAPTQIILCDATCSTITADATGEVDVLTGCKTVVR
jgi:hypothetical protein